MENRTKLKLEYLFNCSPKLLYRFISSPSGLESWFADQVNINDDTYEFKWEGSSSKAKLLENRLNSHTKFQWEESEDEEYFEFRVRQDELTGELSLTITDFCDTNEQEENQMLWDASVNQLRTRLGA